MLEERLINKLVELYGIQKLYIELNRKTKGRYDWRQQAVEAQIDALEQLRDNTNNNWLECYKEDLEESNAK